MSEAAEQLVRNEERNVTATEILLREREAALRWERQVRDRLEQFFDPPLPGPPDPDRDRVRSNYRESQDRLWRGWGDCVDADVELASFLEKCKEFDWDDSVRRSVHVSTFLVGNTPGCKVTRIWAGNEKKGRSLSDHTTPTRRFGTVNISGHPPEIRMPGPRAYDPHQRYMQFLGVPASTFGTPLPFHFRILLRQSLPTAEEFAVASPVACDIDFADHILDVKLENRHGIVVAFWDARDAADLRADERMIREEVRDFVWRYSVGGGS